MSNENANLSEWLMRFSHPGRRTWEKVSFFSRKSYALFAAAASEPAAALLTRPPRFARIAAVAWHNTSMSTWQNRGVIFVRSG